jgi:hypothetical protein
VLLWPMQTIWCERNRWTFEGVEIPNDRLKLLFPRLLFHWMPIDGNSPSTLSHVLHFLLGITLHLDYKSFGFFTL